MSMTGRMMLPNATMADGPHGSRHAENSGCAKVPMCEPEPVDEVWTGIGFNDPDAWGYCEYCAFIVARDLETATLLKHPKRDPGARGGDCNGSERPATLPVPVEAAARPFIFLYKSQGVQLRRKNLHKQRAARAAERAEVARQSEEMIDEGSPVYDVEE